ncbi:MAG: glycosyltransferase family 2 protein [Candidatus Margulisiibacteriota bacterium]
MMDRLLVIVPAFNEQENIANVLQQIHNVSSAFDIVVVNDGSDDDTETIAKKAGVKLLSHPINLGAGSAIQTGLKYAVKEKYDLAVVVDGDGQHDPKDIPKLVEALKTTSSDVVVGSRFLANGLRDIHWARRIGIFLFAKIASFIGRCRITDTTSGFRLFNQRATRFLAKEIPFDFPDADMLLSLLFSGYKIIEVPVEIRERQGGRSMYSTLRSIYYPFKVMIAISAVLLRRLFKGGG